MDQFTLIVNVRDNQVLLIIVIFIILISASKNACSAWKMEIKREPVLVPWFLVDIRNELNVTRLKGGFGYRMKEIFIYLSRLVSRSLCFLVYIGVLMRLVFLHCQVI